MGLSRDNGKENGHILNAGIMGFRPLGLKA